MDGRVRFLVLDAYPREDRDALEEAGGTRAGRLFERALVRIEPRAEVQVVYGADSDVPLPSRSELERYHGVAWTGSSLSVRRADDSRIRRQIEFCREVLASGVPGFGSCFAAQVCAVAAGGECAPSPRGREFGFARRVALSPSGRAHPLYRGKPAVFDAPASHEDEIVRLPSEGELLASNAFSRVQALSVQQAGGSFWAVQYHPEFDLHEIATLCRLRADDLARQGNFPDRETALCYADDLEALHRDPSRSDLVRSLQLGSDVLDEELRTLELRNWVEFQVRPRCVS